jgi:Domain of unknown function (DUF4293)
MIQRPQSIFLLIVIIALIAAMMAPIWNKQEEERTSPELKKTYFIDAWSSQETTYGKSIYTNQFLYACIGFISLIMAGIATYELFRYDNRVMQIKLGALNTLGMIMLLGCILWLTTQQEDSLPLEVPGKYQPGFLLLVVALASNLLANHCIRKDEKLVKSSERMR